MLAVGIEMISVMEIVIEIWIPTITEEEIHALITTKTKTLDSSKERQRDDLEVIAVDRGYYNDDYDRRGDEHYHETGMVEIDSEVTEMTIIMAMSAMSWVWARSYYDEYNRDRDYHRRDGNGSATTI